MRNLGLGHLVLFLSLALGALEAQSASTIFRQSLPEYVQKELSHCQNLPPGPQTLVCELIAALDAEAKDLKTTTTLLSNNDTCRYRSENGHRRHKYATPPSASFLKVMDSYLAMHRRCVTAEMSNITAMYKSGSEGRQPKCRYVIWGSPYNGLGNRIMTLVSAFLYALVTQRVLLIEYPVWPDLFCEPFPSLPVHVWGLGHPMSTRYVALRNAGCYGPKPPKDPEVCANVSIIDTEIHHVSSTRELELAMCPSGLRRAREVPFVLMQRSNQYYTPAYFLNPALSPLLNALFPERNPFHVVARHLLAPSDEVWERILTYTDGPHRGASRSIGVQIREFKGGYTDAFDRNVVQCILRHAGFTPRTFRSPRSSWDFFSVFVSTLEQRHINELNGTLSEVSARTGKEFRVTWQAVDGQEKHDKWHQQEALIDMWLLSLSDVIVVSKKSTFGYVAQGLAGVVAHYLSSEGGKVCDAGAGTDPCYHQPPMDLICDEEDNGESSGTAHDFLSRFESVKACVDLGGPGLQIVSEL